ncbi:MAG TPA: class I SAM-dependent methyltransferase [Bacteroidales bacterium]|nr:class I SAM-dependent methyltransferase [Bacteroidales bacterium]HSA44316.1 class I SAM-dependent methyltransferase [Bacteroidales bacterium]
MNSEKAQRICPVERAGGLDHPVRRFLQHPRKILKPYIRPGMTVLDLGCGPGFFTFEMAKMLQHHGEVIAADVQQGMLDIVSRKIRASGLESLISLHLCGEDRIGLDRAVDFVLAFYMVHEVKDKAKLFHELKSLLKPGGLLCIVEPNFHVSRASFAGMLDMAAQFGLRVVERPGVFFSRSVILSN